MAYAHQPDSQAKVTPAAAASTMHKATTDHAGALVRNLCCAMVSKAFALTSTPGMGIEEFGVGQRSLASVWAVMPAKTTFPANSSARLGSSFSSLREIDGILPGIFPISGGR